MLTPQTITIPAHEFGQVRIAAVQDYLIPGLPVTPLPRPQVLPMRGTLKVPRYARFTPRKTDTDVPRLVIYYGFNRWKLTGEDKARLFKLPIGDYKVVGFASPPGSAVYNQELSMKRAEKVADFLKLLGSKAHATAAGVPAGAVCPPMTLPRNCLPSLRKSEVLVEAIQVHPVHWITVASAHPAPGRLELRMKPVLSRSTSTHPAGRKAMVPSQTPYPLEQWERNAEVASIHKMSSAKPLFNPPLKPLDKALASSEVVKKIPPFKIASPIPATLEKPVTLSQGTLCAVGRQIAEATGIHVHVEGPTLALRQMGMPWGKPVPLESVLNRLRHSGAVSVRFQPEHDLLVLRAQV